MTFDELESFVAIATGGGFTHASRKLHRSQPAISRRIRQLEQSLDARVFERAGRGVRLTAAGQALLPHAEAALAALGDGRRAVRALAAKAKGAHALRLAIVGTLADLTSCARCAASARASATRRSSCAPRRAAR